MATPTDEYIALTKRVNLRAKAAEMLLRWAETTHGNEFGHDHHCPVQWDYQKAWVEAVTEEDLKRCSCGWAEARQAMDASADAHRSDGNGPS